MTILILIFGNLILFAGVLLLVNPETIFGFLRNSIGNTAIHVIAVTVRLIIGTLLITQSDESRFPFTVDIIGLIFILSGITLAAIGSRKFHKLMSWVIANLVSVGRYIGLVALVFGGFLVYAFL